jgi:hypothetical protein
MTMQATANGGDAAGTSPADSFVLSRAEDGSVLLVMEGGDLSPARGVDVTVRDGVLSVAQSGADGVRRVVVRARVDADGRAFLAALPPLDLVEVYLGETDDETRFERHPATNVRLTYEGRAGHG